MLRFCYDQEDNRDEDDVSNLPYGPWVRASPLKQASLTVMRQEGRTPLCKKTLPFDIGESSTSEGTCQSEKEEVDSEAIKAPLKALVEKQVTVTDSGKHSPPKGDKQPTLGTTAVMESPTTIITATGLMESLGKFSLHHKEPQNETESTRTFIDLCPEKEPYQTPTNTKEHIKENLKQTIKEPRAEEVQS